MSIDTYVCFGHYFKLKDDVSDDIRKLTDDFDADIKFANDPIDALITERFVEFGEWHFRMFTYNN